ncbi:exodeoxyribonuclease X, partial [Salmonella enterica subsp. enterica serovar Enteritidis str. 50-5646]
PGYLRWLFNNLDNMSPELRLTLKHYLEDVQAGEQRSNGTPQ